MKRHVRSIVSEQVCPRCAPALWRLESTPFSLALGIGLAPKPNAQEAHMHSNNKTASRVAALDAVNELRPVWQGQRSSSILDAWINQVTPKSPRLTTSAVEHSSMCSVDDINTLRSHISKAEASGRISWGFALRLRLQADRAEQKLQPPTRIDRAFSAVDKVFARHHLEVIRGGR